MKKNYYEEKGVNKTIHDGEGLIKSVQLFKKEDFQTNLGYIAVTTIPIGASIGYHEHDKEIEEVYTIQSGEGLFTLDGETSAVTKGDVLVTPIGSKHGLQNTGKTPMEVFVFYVYK